MDRETQHRIIELERERDEKALEVERLRAQLEAKDTRIHTLRDERDELAADRDQEKTRANAAEEERDHARHELMDATNAYAELAGEVEKLHESARRERTALTSLRGDFESARAELRDRTNAYGELLAEIGPLRKAWTDTRHDLGRIAGALNPVPPCDKTDDVRGDVESIVAAAVAWRKAYVALYGERDELAERWAVTHEQANEWSRKAHAALACISDLEAKVAHLERDMAQAREQHAHALQQARHHGEMLSGALARATFQAVERES